MVAYKSKTYSMVSRGIYEPQEVDFNFEVHKSMEIEDVRKFFEGFMTYVKFKKDKIESRRKEEALILHAKALVLSKAITEAKE